MKLVILESPTKTKALTKYLGTDFLVLSCSGHINRLVKDGQYSLGINLDSFDMHFEVDKKKKWIVKELFNQAKKADIIYLATDPDREGEAIAYHVKNILPKNSKIFRVTFNEITPKIVRKAFDNPGKLNKKIVESQFARRAIDRIIGFRLSNLLRTKIYAPSAGRVQSIALFIIVDREKEIKKFIPETFFSIFTEYKKNKKIYLVNSKLEKNLFNTENEVNEILEKISKELSIIKINDKFWIKKSPKPLTTAELLQIGMSELKYSSKKIMFLVQKLYEGIEIDGDIIGLITYPRTDSIRINVDFINEIKNKIEFIFGKEYKKNKITENKSKQKIQDAHEAIRVTNLEFTPEKMLNYLSYEQNRIYKLIYERTLISFMSDIKGTTRQYILNNKKTKYNFLFEEEKITFDGFNKIKNKKLKTIDFLDLKLNDLIKIEKFEKESFITKPKSRYSESKMIKKMHNLGIGRPSTYASIVTKLLDWGYLLKNSESKLVPTQKGMIVNEKLQEFFSEIINTTYTSDMEKDLDLISIGEKDWKVFLKTFYKKFSEKMEIAKTEMKGSEIKKLDKKCPNCESILQEREGKFGKFIGCSNYPKCKFIEKLKTEENNTESKKLDKKCPDCESQLVERKGRFGIFVACSGYPECKYIEKNKNLNVVKLDKKCPDCESQLVERKGRFGIFVACSGYPKCKFIEKRVKN